uniref:Protein MIZU-KUSSEI 1 n=1 Tax=Ananas comosus var. bracteatus TaxID=296719 RepID=A0A6V7Q5H6_ANACO|nr:unnamed protein product [Ananas comosus var. bracteatus]
MGRSFNPSSFPSKRNFQKMPKEEERGGRGGGERVKRDKEEELREEGLFLSPQLPPLKPPSLLQKHFFSAFSVRSLDAQAPVGSCGGNCRWESTEQPWPYRRPPPDGGRHALRPAAGPRPLGLPGRPRTPPALLLELAAPTAALVREMASGLVRIALECDHASSAAPLPPLLEEPVWRAYCNGRKCGRAVRRECGDSDRDVLRAVEAVSVGAGVLPAGSRDSEAFYMMSPDGTGGGPELSIYLLRV